MDSVLFAVKTALNALDTLDHEDFAEVARRELSYVISLLEEKTPPIPKD